MDDVLYNWIKNLRYYVLWGDIMSGKSLKLMALGIALMLMGIYINLEEGLSQYTYGNEFFIVLLGFIIAIVGFIKKD